MSFLAQYSPAPPAVRRLRAVICAGLGVMLLAGCQQWPSHPVPWTALFEPTGDHVAGSDNWQDAYRIESTDVLRWELADGEHTALERTQRIGFDGQIRTGKSGSVYVAGKSLPAAARAIEHRLADTGMLGRSKVSLSVAEHNSRYCYCVVQGQGRRDGVTRVPLGKSDTVFDALSHIEGLSHLSTSDIWIARTPPGSPGPCQILPVDMGAITRAESLATNYQLMPGDRLYVQTDQDVLPASARNTLDGIYRTLELEGIGSTTIEQFQKLGHDGS